MMEVDKFMEQTQEICWFEHPRMIEKALCVCNRVEMDAQMKVWRKAHRHGKIFIHDYNCKTSTQAPDGKEWHFLVVQNADLEKSWNSPIGLFLLGEYVSGTIYAFKSKKNRDAVQKYVMKPK